MSKRRTHSPEFKTRVGIEAIAGRKTLQAIAAFHPIYPIQVSQWNMQLLYGDSGLYTRGDKKWDKSAVLWLYGDELNR
jgi:transposase-like protein